MQKIEIQGEYREIGGKGVARQLRRDGKIPAVLYSKGKAVSLVLDPREVTAILHSAAGENTLITLNISGKKKEQHVAILRDYQKDPINGEILHADLFEISMKEMIEVKVLVELIGDKPIGVKSENGVLRHHLREIEVRCLPTKIPDHIQIDASGLAVGDTIHIGDLSLEKGIEVIGQPTQAIVSVTTSMSEEKLESLLSSGPEAAEETPEEGAEEAAKEEKTGD